MKFKIGDIITNGEVTFRIEKIGQNHFGYYYKLVNVDTEKKGLRYLKESDGSYFGETGWLCEQVDELFHLVQDKPQVINQNTIFIKVRIDYTHKGNEMHEQTAADMVVKRMEELCSVVDGVQVTNVEVYLDGEELKR